MFATAHVVPAPRNAPVTYSSAPDSVVPFVPSPRTSPDATNSLAQLTAPTESGLPSLKGNAIAVAAVVTDTVSVPSPDTLLSAALTVAQQKEPKLATNTPAPKTASTLKLHPTVLMASAAGVSGLNAPSLVALVPRPVLVRSNSKHFSVVVHALLLLNRLVSATRTLAPWIAKPALGSLSTLVPPLAVLVSR